MSITNEQQEAINYLGNNVLVSASAGSGKTFVLTERICNLIINHHYHLNELIILTFTNDAAAMMKDRIRKKIREKITQISDQSDINRLQYELEHLDEAHIETFDSFTGQLVKQFNYKLNISKHYNIMNSSFEELLLKKEFDELVSKIDNGNNDLINKAIKNIINKLDYPKISDYKQLLLEIYIKTTLIPEYHENFFNDFFNKDLYSDEYKEKYQDLIKDISTIINHFIMKISEFKDKYQLFTFNDIAKKAIILLNDEDIINYFHQTIKGVMVDEYQDTSDIQEALINKIANHNCFMVGDIKQSIYLFRNANPKLFMDKYQDYKENKGGHLISLTNNFRSDPNFIDDINQMFEKIFVKTKYDNCLNIEYKDGHAYNLLEKLNPISKNHIYTLPYETIKNDENGIIQAHIVAKKILELKDEYNYKDFYILSHQTSNFDIFKKVLTSYKIPVILGKERKIFQKDEISFVISVLKYNLDKTDEDSKRLYLMEIMRSFVVRMNDDDIHKVIINKSLKGINDELDVKLKTIASLYYNHNISEIIKAIYDEFDIYNNLVYIKNYKDAENNLVGLLNSSKMYQNIPLDLYIKYLDESRNAESNETLTDVPNENINAVKIFTTFASKGTENKVCFLIDTYKKGNERSITTTKSLYSSKYGLVITGSEIYDKVKDSLLHEDREERMRLFYVAVTRAIDRLYILDNISGKDVADDFLYHNNPINNLYKMANTAITLPIFSGEISEMISNQTRIKKEKIASYCQNIIDYDIINQPIEVVNYERPSKQLYDIVDEKTKKAMETGLKFHKELEFTSITDAKKVKYHDSYLIHQFINSDFIQSLNIINEYHEYAYYDLQGHESIIDLILETDNEMIIIDYKLANADSEAYVRQLTKYKEIVSTLTNKPISCYLYSIVKGIFCLVEIK